MAHRYELTFEDFKYAQRLHRQHRMGARISFLVWFRLLPAIAVLLFAVVLWARTTGRIVIYTGVLPAAVGLAVWMAFLAAVRPLTYRRLYRKLLPDGTKGNVPVEFSFGEEGVRSAIIGRSEGRFFWNAIVDYTEDDSMALLYIKKKLFLYVPKRALPESEWQQLRGFVQQPKSVVPPC